MSDRMDWRVKSAFAVFCISAMFIGIILGSRAVLSDAVIEALRNEAEHHALLWGNQLTQDFPGLERVPLKAWQMKTS